MKQAVRKRTLGNWPLSSYTTEGMHFKHTTCIINVDILDLFARCHLKFESPKSI